MDVYAQYGKLAHKVTNTALRRFRIRRSEWEDCHQVGLLALCKAYESWDGQRPFHNYAWRAVQNDVTLYIVRQILRSRLKQVSEKVFLSLEIERPEFYDLALVQDLLKMLSEKEREVVLLVLELESRTKAAKQLNLSRERVRQIEARALHKMAYSVGETPVSLSQV